MVAYIAQNRDLKVCQVSTSGGVFSALTECIFQQGGLVVGAAYRNKLEVAHEIVKSSDENLSRLRGVKYLKGTIGRDVYVGMRQALQSHRKVLFTGLPCQAAAVRKMFSEEPNLVICELVCFGAPPLKLWRKYVSWLEAKRGVRLRKIDPRDKSFGWGRKTYYRYEWADGKVERKESSQDPYARAFYSTLGFCNCCFSCLFKGEGSRADLTIGDGWGIERDPSWAKSIDHPELGVSAVIVRTERGRAIFEKADLASVKVPIDDLTVANDPILHAAQRPERWAQFQQDVEGMDFQSLIRKYNLQTNWRTWLWSRLLVLLRKVVRKLKK